MRRAARPDYSRKWNNSCILGAITPRFVIMHQDHLEHLEASILSGLAELETLEPREAPAFIGPGVRTSSVLTLYIDVANDATSQSDGASRSHSKAKRPVRRSPGHN
jgi:hypothetical protein